MKELIQIGRGLSQISQLGMSLAAPLILSIAGVGWLSKKFGWGTEVMLIGIILGIGGSIASFMKFYHDATKKKGGKQT